MLQARKNTKRGRNEVLSHLPLCRLMCCSASTRREMRERSMFSKKSSSDSCSPTIGLRRHSRRPLASESSMGAAGAFRAPTIGSLFGPLFGPSLGPLGIWYRSAVDCAHVRAMEEVPSACSLGWLQCQLHGAQRVPPALPAALSCPLPQACQLQAMGVPHPGKC